MTVTADVEAINYKSFIPAADRARRSKNRLPVCFSMSTAVSPAQDAAVSKTRHFIGVEASATGHAI
jgi:hypothetical protein